MNQHKKRIHHSKDVGFDSNDNSLRGFCIVKLTDTAKLPDICITNLMEEGILNRVANSGIVTLNLEHYLHPGKRVGIDVKDTLFMGLILKEKDFRDWIKNHDWEQYRNTNVYIYCSADAIVPSWAYMLTAGKLTGIANFFLFGNAEALDTALFMQALSTINPAEYADKRVVIKGCGDQYVTPAAYVEVTRLLQPYVKSLMFGEPCSTVPVFKKA